MSKWKYLKQFESTLVNLIMNWKGRLQIYLQMFHSEKVIGFLSLAILIILFESGQWKENFRIETLLINSGTTSNWIAKKITLLKVLKATSLRVKRIFSKINNAKTKFSSNCLEENVCESQDPVRKDWYHSLIWVFFDFLKDY